MSAGGMRRVLAAAGLAVLIEGNAAAQARLRDPFQAPPAAAVVPAPDAQLQTAPAPEWKPDLRAVVYDGKKSLVNIGGHILGLGESIAGFRVVTVEERSAVLVKDGVRLKLMLDKEQEK